MKENAKRVIFKVQNVAYYAFFWGKFSKNLKCAGVKYLTNMMSDVASLNSSLDNMSPGTKYVQGQNVPNQKAHLYICVNCVTICHILSSK